MNTHDLFSDFDKTIRLNESKIQKLRSNRNTLREKIRDHFKQNGWEVPIFHSQGSFPLNTNLNPIIKITKDGEVKEEYDLDDGVYFICSEIDRKEPASYHSRILKAVEGHAESTTDKNTCVRVIYTDGHHIDLPAFWIEKEGAIPKLAHKSQGYFDSDPIAFKDWVDDNISKADSNGQLRRMIRYFKAWKNYRETKNSNLRLPTGFILTILVCTNFFRDNRDDLSFKLTADAIKTTLNINFSCYRPTVPTDEELLSGYSKVIVMNELESLSYNASKAIESGCDKEASEFWRKVFGDRFPLGEENEDENNQAIESKTNRIVVSAPWLSV